MNPQQEMKDMFKKLGGMAKDKLTEKKDELKQTKDDKMEELKKQKEEKEKELQKKKEDKIAEMQEYKDGKIEEIQGLPDTAKEAALEKAKEKVFGKEEEEEE